MFTRARLCVCVFVRYRHVLLLLKPPPDVVLFVKMSDEAMSIVLLITVTSPDPPSSVATADELRRTGGGGRFGGSLEPADGGRVRDGDDVIKRNAPLFRSPLFYFLYVMATSDVLKLKIRRA